MSDLDSDFLNSVHYLSGGCYNGNRAPRHPTRVITNHELIMVRSESLQLYEGEEQFNTHKNQFLYLEPGIEHGSWSDYIEGLSFYWFHFELPDAQNFPIKTGHFRRPEIANDLASRLLDESERGDGPKVAAHYLMRLLLLECSVVQDQVQQDPSGLVDRAQLFIRRHFHEAISARDVAEHCDCHPDHLGRLFKARMHISLSDSIRRARLRRARVLLRDSEHSIEEIAIMAGFSESHYFRRCFKAALGVTPSKWRSMHRRAYIN